MYRTLITLGYLASKVASKRQSNAAITYPRFKGLGSVRVVVNKRYSLAVGIVVGLGVLSRVI